ncbi:hypothetical protein G5I_06346 [Acromyrmex echinatior]|uniref:Uncharacterized protein n=1 Tax=Acromyrmex echinatior TaxID=103372 RepID=F4WKS6_ACREC|nr:hypothetical protein G5I_06346 [Acromyrmex echinatior]
MLIGCLESVTAADVIFCGIQEYKPQRINYVSSVIRLMLVYTERDYINIYAVRETSVALSSNALLRYFVLYLAWLASTSPCARIVSRGSIETSSETFKFGDPRLIARADRKDPQRCVRRTFNSRDSNLYRAAVWIVPFREDYVNIYTASEIPGDFPTALIPYIPFLAMDRGFYRNGKLLNSKRDRSRATAIRKARNFLSRPGLRKRANILCRQLGWTCGAGPIASTSEVENFLVRIAPLKSSDNVSVRLNNIDGNAFLNRQADHVLEWPAKPKRNSDDVSSGRDAIAITYCLPITAQEIWESL